MNIEISADMVNRAWMFILLIVGISGIWSRWAWSTFFGVATVALTYQGHWYAVIHALVFAMELTSAITKEPLAKTVYEAVKS